MHTHAFAGGGSQFLGCRVGALSAAAAAAAAAAGACGERCTGAAGRCCRWQPGSAQLGGAREGSQAMLAQQRPTSLGRCLQHACCAGEQGNRQQRQQLCSSAPPRQLAPRRRCEEVVEDASHSPLLLHCFHADQSTAEHFPGRSGRRQGRRCSCRRPPPPGHRRRHGGAAAPQSTLLLALQVYLHGICRLANS